MAGWNGSDRRGNSTPVKPKVSAKKPSPIRGLIAGLVVVALAAGVYFAFLNGSVKSQAEDDGRSRKIKEVKPAKSGVASRPIERKKVEKTGNKVDDAIAEVDAIEPLKIAKRPVLNIPAHYTNRTFKTGAEQLMSWVFTKELGDMPTPLPRMSDDDYKNLAAILISKNEINEDDDERDAAAKECVDYAKKEMMKFIKEGGDPEEFLDYYQRELQKAYEKRQMAMDEVLELEEDDPELALEFAKKINEKFGEEGIKALPTKRLEKKLGVEEPESDAAAET